jgi:hypothetical protein
MKGGPRRRSRLRLKIAREAARLMYEEGIGQYFDAKHMAAKRILGRSQSKKLRYRPHDLPSNGEIKEALLELVQFAEGKNRVRRLFAMRMVALESMIDLMEFEPRLIGSVANGGIRRGSDIDLHLFVEDIEQLEEHLLCLGWDFGTEEVTILKNGEYRDYIHIYVDRGFPVEMSVYPPRELRITTRASTHGKPIDRVGYARLKALIQREHPDEWERYLEEGVFQVEDYMEDLSAPEPFAGLLAELQGK